jgi:AcrR family transcriptional regulator
MADTLPEPIKITSRRQWIELGLALLAEEGPGGLTVHALCHRAQRTTGAFYHHFGAFETYINALIEHWRQDHTDRIISTVTDVDDPLEQRRALTRLVAGIDYEVELAFRAWSATHDGVKSAVGDVDQMRLAFIAKLVGQLDHRADMSARELATIEYAAFIGFQYLFTNRPAEERERVIHRLTALISSDIES